VLAVPRDKERRDRSHKRNRTPTHARRGPYRCASCQTWPRIVSLRPNRGSIRMVSIRFASPRCQTWPASPRFVAIRGRHDSLVPRRATKRGRIVRKRSRSPRSLPTPDTHTLQDSQQPDLADLLGGPRQAAGGDLAELPGGPHRSAGGNFAKYPGTVRSARHASRRPPSLASPPARPDVALGRHVRPPAFDQPHEGAQRVTGY